MILNELMLYVLSVYVRAYKNFLFKTVNHELPREMIEKCILACVDRDVFDNVSDYKLVEHRGVLCYENPRYNADCTRHSITGGMEPPFRRPVIEYLINMCIFYDPTEDHTLGGYLGPFLKLNKRNKWLMGAMSGVVCDGPVCDPDWSKGIFHYYCQSNYSNRGDVIDRIVREYNAILIAENPKLKKFKAEYEINPHKKNELEIFIEYPRR